MFNKMDQKAYLTYIQIHQLCRIMRTWLRAIHSQNTKKVQKIIMGSIGEIVQGKCTMIILKTAPALVII